LTFESDQAPAEIDITTCSLDDPEAEPPRDHTRTHSQMSWIAHDGLPRFPEARSDAPAATGTHYDVAVVRVFVHDWPRAVAFYADTLGMRIVTRKDEYKWAEFDVGGCTLAIEELARDDPEAAELVGRYVGISIRVPDIDATYRELTARGVDFRSAPRRQPWGGVLAHLADPEGNVLTLLGEWAGS
jgi:predicted enzyme related to lactoylglutathione lyase